MNDNKELLRAFFTRAMVMPGDDARKILQVLVKYDLKPSELINERAEQAMFPALVASKTGQIRAN